MVVRMQCRAGHNPQKFSIRGFVLWNILKSKAMVEKECNHLNKSACFQSNHSENLKIFLCAYKAKGGYCEGEGNACFFDIWQSESCSLSGFTDINPFLHITFLYYLKDFGAFISTLLTVSPTSQWLSNLPRITPPRSRRAGFRP